MLHGRQATPGSSLDYQELLSLLQPLASCARLPDVPQEGPTRDRHPAGARGGGLAGPGRLCGLTCMSLS